MTEQHLPLEYSGLKLFIADNKEHITASQKLRYEIFYKEMGAIPSPQMKAEERDFDHYDDFCDHLLVQDTKNGEIVGTYRLLRREHAKNAGGFYTRNEFDISKLEAYNGEILELGRSCILPEYRTKLVLQFLWAGIAAYILTYDIRILFGCASFPSSNIEEHKKDLSYLYHHHLVPEEIKVKAHDKFYNDMNYIKKEDLSEPIRIMTKLPPLIKGYLRAGATIADGAFIDEQFNTTDVGIIVKREDIPQQLFDKVRRMGQ